MDAKDKAEFEKIELELSQAKALDYIDGIGRCTNRLRRLIELEAPRLIVLNEIRMIQYRALATLGVYDFLKSQKDIAHLLKGE